MYCLPLDNNYMFGVTINNTTISRHHINLAEKSQHKIDSFCFCYNPVSMETLAPPFISPNIGNQ